MTTNPTIDPHDITNSPEYNRAYVHYSGQGAPPEEAARLAAEYVRTHATPIPTTTPKSSTAKTLLIVGLILAGVFFFALIGIFASPPDSENPATVKPVITTQPAAVVTTESASMTPPPPPTPATYAKITARQWQLIAKNPDAYVGKGYIVYGVVTQFDAATGTEGFRADVDGLRRWNDYDYSTNTVLTGEPAILKNVVQGDMFTAKVTVDGSYSYDTQIGGSTTVPQLTVVSITVLT